MASRSVSPGGALLRASRVFSIPAPLPRPTGELSTKAVLNSDTATLPHPIQLSITTPPSSRARGDWGFKRPLPLRSTTKTSTPFIKVEAIDTFEHITEYGSSADHALSLQKWQEMGVPLTVPVTKNTGTYQHGERKSVFEDDMDSTIEPTGESRKEDVRWNFKGPWLAGMTEGEFNIYLTKKIRDKKSEFRKYLQAACAKSLTAQARRQAIGEEEFPVNVETGDVSEAQMTEYLKVLRYDRTELYKLIRAFLDMPPPPSVTPALVEQFLGDVFGSDGKKDQVMEQTPDSPSPYAKNGPPSTHPSAGLSYSLTNAHAYNHPQFGPQKYPAPVKARVVLPRNAGVGNFAPALGVGGFVTALPDGEASGFKTSAQRGFQRGTSNIPGVDKIELEKVGGSKVYVEPMHAQIDPSGKVILTTRVADMDAVAVHEGTTDQIRQPSTYGGTAKPGWKPAEGLHQASVAGSRFAYGLSEATTAARRAREDEVARDMASLIASSDDRV
jgi:hypothetical protein